ncbi:MAG: hypothetical protein PHR18_01825 [Oscillospiraceae bacterium]|nr:hypothetical protein [Oscillospiraceae bacterium]MDD3832624.1 hypothetical protein [Oscillospiraceae bacterium]
MTRVQQARQRLKGHRLKAIAVEFIAVAAGMLVPIASLTVLRLSGLGAERMIHASELINKWYYALITVGLFALDWLLISPLLLGRLAFYMDIAAGDEVKVRVIFKFYVIRYSHALRWRLSIQIRRLLYWSVCLLPAAFASGVAKAVRASGSMTPASDVIIMFCTLFGTLFFLAGLLFSETLMLRKLPAAYLVINNRDKKYPKRIIRTSSKIMKGHIIDTFQLITGFGGWLAACIFLIPYFYVMPLFFTTRTIAVRKFICKSMNEESDRYKIAITQDTIILPNQRQRI